MINKANDPLRLTHCFSCLADEEIYEGFSSQIGPSSIWLMPDEAKRLSETTNAHPNDEIRFEWDGDTLIYIRKDGGVVTKIHIRPSSIVASDTDKIVSVYDTSHMDFMWSRPVTTWSFGLGNLNSADDVLCWFRALLFIDGCNFHPDTPFGDYVKSDTMIPLYTMGQTRLLDRLMRQAFYTCECDGCDIYQLAMLADRSYREYFGIEVPGLDEDPITYEVSTDSGKTWQDMHEAVMRRHLYDSYLPYNIGSKPMCGYRRAELSYTHSSYQDSSPLFTAWLSNEDLALGIGIAPYFELKELLQIMCFDNSTAHRWLTDGEVFVILGSNDGEEDVILRPKYIDVGEVVLRSVYKLDLPGWLWVSPVKL